MIELACGKNYFLLNEHVRGLIAQYREQHGEDSVIQLDAGEIDWDALHQAVTGMSLFADDEKLVVVQRIEQNIGLANRVAERIEQLSSSTHLLFVSAKIDKRSTFYKTIKKEAIVTPFEQPKEYELVRWLQEYVKENDGKISSSDAQHLVNRVGENQQLLASEVRKLVTFDPTITKEIIDRLVAKTMQDTIFELLDAITAGSQGRALEIYESLRQQQVQPIYIITMIGWHLHSLLVVSLAGTRSEREIAKDNGISPYVIGKAMKLKRKLSKGGVEKMLQATAASDLRIKTTSVDSDQVLKTLIIELADAV